MKAAKTADDAAEATLEAANKAFNSTLKSENAKVATAVANRDAANRALDKAQDAANSAKFTMDTKTDLFNKAVLALEDTINLCNQPQPPSNCARQLASAQASVKSSNTTMKQATRAYNTKAAKLTAAQTALQNAETAFTGAITHKDTALNAATSAIEDAVMKKQATAAALNTLSKKCAPGGRRLLGAPGRQGYHL